MHLFHLKCTTEYIGILMDTFAEQSIFVDFVCNGNLDISDECNKIHI